MMDVIAYPFPYLSQTMSVKGTPWNPDTEETNPWNIKAQIKWPLFCQKIFSNAISWERKNQNKISPQGVPGAIIDNASTLV